MFYNNMYKPTQDERIWVQGETSAEAYLVAPNGFVRLWDSAEPIFYEKRADATGRPLPMEAYKYERIMLKNGQNAQNGAIDYQEQINAIMGRLDALERGQNHDTESTANVTAIQPI